MATISRLLRVENARAAYDVTSQGISRSSMREDDGDRHVFLSVIGRLVNRTCSPKIGPVDMLGSPV